MNPFVRAKGLSMDAADSAKSYLEIKKRFESVRWRSGGILYPPARQGKSPRKEHQGGSLIPPDREW